jgi:hypothetical protein
MTNRKRYLKLVAFVPAIILAGGLIGYRAGAFHLFDAPQPPPEPAAVVPPAAPLFFPLDDNAYMAGSKSSKPAIPLPPGADVSGILSTSGSGAQPAPPPVSPAAPAAPPAAAPEKPPVFIGGSKSAPIFPLPTPNQPGQTPNPPAPKGGHPRRRWNLTPRSGNRG